MNENVNLCEILKSCPKWTKFYSYIHGEVEFVEVTNLRSPIHIMTFPKDGNSISTFLTKEGYISEHYSNQSCILVPSLEQPDWSKWKCPKPKFNPKTLKPFDRILVRDYKGTSWVCGLFSCFMHEKIMTTVGWNYGIPYNDKTKHLIGTTDEAPIYYRYWEN